MTAHPITDKTLTEWGVRDLDGKVYHAADEAQARRWLGYSNSDVLVKRHHGQDWHVVEAEA